jgi:hypothetical protein
MEIFGTAAPLGSTTFPSMFPVVACDCAAPLSAEIATKIVIDTSLARRVEILNILTSLESGYRDALCGKALKFISCLGS